MVFWSYICCHLLEHLVPNVYMYFILFCFGFFSYAFYHRSTQRMWISRVLVLLSQQLKTKSARSMKCAQTKQCFFSHLIERKKRSNRLMHMHIEHKTNDRREGDKKITQSTNTDYKANAYNSDAYADLWSFLCSFRTPNRITKNTSKMKSIHIHEKKAFPPLCFIHFRCAAGVVVNNSNTHPMCLCFALFNTFGFVGLICCV